MAETEIPVSVGPDAAAIADKIQEIRFYISQGFWDIAHSALSDLVETAPDAPEIGQLKAALSEAQAKAGASVESTPAVEEKPQAPAVPTADAAPLVQEFILDAPDQLSVVEEEPANVPAQVIEELSPSPEPGPPQQHRKNLMMCWKILFGS